MNPNPSFRRAGNFLASTFMLLCIGIHRVEAAAEPMDPFHIAGVLSRFTIPRVELRNVTIGEALKFYAMKYHSVLGEPPETDFDFEIRLPHDVLQRHVSLEATDITLLEALERTLKDIPVAITLESGKVILSSPPVFPDLKPAPAKP